MAKAKKKSVAKKAPAQKSKTKWKTKAKPKANAKVTSKSKAGKKAKPKAEAKAKTKAKSKATAKTKSTVKAHAKAKSPAKKSPTQKAATASHAPKPSVVAKTSTQPAIKKSSAKINWAEFFTPLDDRVLLEQAETLTQTPGGLFIPDSNQEKPNEGQVLAVGPGGRDKKGRRQPLDVKLGDQVMFSPYVGTKLNLHGKDVILVKESDILAVI